MRTIVSIFMISLCCIPLASQEVDDFTAGIKAYEQHDYETALTHFRSELHTVSKPADSNVLYNIGNCYFRLGQPGRARYFYELALQANRDDEDILHNINTIEESFLDAEMRSVHFAGFDVTMHRLLELARPGIAFWLAIVAFIFINVVVFIRILKPTVFSNTRMWLILIPLGLLLIVCTSIVVGYQMLDKQITFGIITGSAEYAYSEPSNRAPGRFPVPEAAKARIKREVEGWYEISLPDKTTGWIKADDIALINNDSN